MDPWSLGVGGKFSENLDGAEANKICPLAEATACDQTDRAGTSFKGWGRDCGSPHSESWAHLITLADPHSAVVDATTADCLFRIVIICNICTGCVLRGAKQKHFTVNVESVISSAAASGQYGPAAAREIAIEKSACLSASDSARGFKTCTAGTLSTYHLTAVFAGYACVILFTVRH
jgi:hypothetical protein